MKTYYVYHVTIMHPKGWLHYIGQHGWDGSGLDPSYHGSCMYGSWLGKVRWGAHASVGKLYYDWCIKYGYFTEVLEYCNTSNELNDAERYWIDSHLEMYGSKLYGTPGKDFLSKYGYGTCLNGTLGGCVLQDSRVVAKRNETRKQRGHFDDSQLHTPEAIAKSVATRRMNGTLGKNHKVLHTPEAIAKSVAAHDYKRIHTAEVHEKIRNALQTNARKLCCISPTGEVHVCCSGQLKELFPDNASAAGILSRMYRGLLPNPYYPTSSSSLYGWHFKISKS